MDWQTRTMSRDEVAILERGDWMTADCEGDDLGAIAFSRMTKDELVEAIADREHNDEARARREAAERGGPR